MYQERFVFLYALLAAVAAAAVVAVLGWTAFGQHVRVVTRVKAAPPITSLTAAKHGVRGKPLGADAGLPDGCTGVYVDGGAVIFCEGG